MKHLLVADLAKRYGNLKNGVNDIKNHRWFKKFDFKNCLNLNLNAPFVPTIKGEGDTSNYSQYPDDSPNPPKALDPDEDPFLNW